MLSPIPGGDVVDERPRSDKVLASTRVLAAAIVPFLVLAFVVLVPWPTDTKRLFAWEIKPTMSPMVLGSVYLGGAYFFLRVVRATRWHSVAGGFVPVGHVRDVDGRNDDPALGPVPARQHRVLAVGRPVLHHAVAGVHGVLPQPAGVSTRPPTPPGASVRWQRAALVLAGVASMAMCVFLYLFPSRAVAVWPWQLTPLTARMLGAIFALGVAGVGAWWERRWSAIRILLQVAGFMLVLILIAATRAHSEFDTSNALTWLFLVGFVMTTVALVGALCAHGVAVIVRPRRTAPEDANVGLGGSARHSAHGGVKGRC